MRLDVDSVADPLGCDDYGDWVPCGLSAVAHQRVSISVRMKRGIPIEHLKPRPRMDGGVAFTPSERSALDKVPPTKQLVCGWCKRVTTYRRGILNGRVVWACEALCGSLSASGVLVDYLPGE